MAIYVYRTWFDPIGTRGEHANDYTTDESLWWAFLVCFSANTYIVQWRIQDFKLGGGQILKNCAERREARKMLGYFVWKITIFYKKILFFQILGGVGGAECAPTESAPVVYINDNR